MKQEHPVSGSNSSASSSDNEKRKSRIQWLPFLDERRHAMDQHQQRLGYSISNGYMDRYTVCDAWLEQQIHSPSSCSSSNSSSPSLSLANNPRWGAETRHNYHQHHHQQHVPSLFATAVAPPLTPPQHDRMMIDSSSTCSTNNTPYYHHTNTMMIPSSHHHPVKQQHLHHSASFLPTPVQSSCISLPSIVDLTSTPICNRRPFAFLWSIQSQQHLFQCNEYIIQRHYIHSFITIWWCSPFTIWHA